MKNYTTKITAALLSVMMLGAVGCGQGTSAGTPVEQPDSTADTTATVQQEEEVTVESLMKGLQEKANTSEGLAYNIDMDMAVEVTIFGEKASSDTQGTGICESDGVNTHTKITITSETDGETTSEETETYYIKEGEKFTKYELSDGKWYKSTDETNGGVDFNKMTDFDFSTATLDTTDTEYVVAANLAYDDVDDVVPTQSDEIGVEPDTSRTDNVQIPVEFHFDKETKELTSIFMDMGTALNEVMKQATDEALADAAKQNGVDAPSDSAAIFAMDITKFTTTMRDFDFTAHVVELPEEAKDATEKPTIGQSQSNIPSASEPEVPAETAPTATN